ncbi:hypothetical protein IJI94_02200 [Candidatus Saccharibacteria bacterium]|nr:hypothetical protein [Candidatus Saccharibacteria bacterium]
MAEIKILKIDRDLVIAVIDDKEEYLTPEEFLLAYGDEAENFIPTRKETITEEEYYYEYWAAGLEIIGSWGKYQQAKKLYDNFTRKETRHMVAEVVEKHFGGKSYRIKNRELQLSKELDEKIEDFTKVCHKFSVEPISRDWLYRNLKNSADCKSLRGKVNRRIGKPPISLKQLV